ncbi:GNAT family N-acetyltransferase [Streptomyces sp. CA2R101]|uniref:GNAT family N-acetyltransferase n=1 Tax=Streptomyces sp. CA2R101 TaxID=3120152 RepID=UPI0030083356
MGAVALFGEVVEADRVEGGLGDPFGAVDQGGDRGLGPDAARALISCLCGTLGWRRVTVDPVATNVRAVRAWEKAGFRCMSGDGQTLVMEYRPAP